MVTPGFVVLATLPFRDFAEELVFLAGAVVDSITDAERVLGDGVTDLLGVFVAGFAAGRAWTGAFLADFAGAAGFVARMALVALTVLAALLALAALTGALRSAATGLRAGTPAFFGAVLRTFAATGLAADGLAFALGLAALGALFALLRVAVAERATVLVDLLPAFGFCFDFAISVLTL